ncbi:methylated-DNA--[protein]-cysteine S-methyltransferase [Thalassotalea psychrophila]|uniref:Methylated-DNA--protein-cysteine methyltransferase n=1 Tax=Thalassotalea psychrophila TaxID=3065647 RepID=A0ABY9TRR9_9GAMM|nr:methylated-DNA--[protein]-cysteine S-methyltransferase [Colwelliaceae bacterium SQ149]
MKNYYDILSTNCGDVAIVANEVGIVEVAFQQGKVAVGINNEYQLFDENAPLHLAQAKQQLAEYFAGSRKYFDVPLAQNGTVFQSKVWQELTNIPFGKTINYGQLAKNINNPKAVRAVGTANGANKIAIIVPCHRVIGSDKKLTGYAGGMGIKAKLLMLEGAHFKV